MDRYAGALIVLALVGAMSASAAAATPADSNLLREIAAAETRIDAFNTIVAARLAKRSPHQMLYTNARRQIQILNAKLHELPDDPAVAIKREEFVMAIAEGLASIERAHVNAGGDEMNILGQMESLERTIAVLRPTCDARSSDKDIAVRCATLAAHVDIFRKNAEGIGQRFIQVEQAYQREQALLADLRAGESASR